MDSILILSIIHNRRTDFHINKYYVHIDKIIGQCGQIYCSKN